MVAGIDTLDPCFYVGHVGDGRSSGDATFVTHLPGKVTGDRERGPTRKGVATKSVCGVTRPIDTIETFLQLRRVESATPRTSDRPTSLPPKKVGENVVLLPDRRLKVRVGPWSDRTTRSGDTEDVVLTQVGGYPCLNPPLSCVPNTPPEGGT